jgi:hypothetical protein
MRINFGRLSVLTAAIAAIGLMGALSASASADSITCEISGAIKLSPGLSETPTVQNVGITAHKGAKLANCKGVETTVTGGSIHVVAKTKEAITCKVLKELPGAALESANDAIFKWAPYGNNSTGSLNVPITAMAGASFSGSVAMGAFPFSEDKITGTVKETYSGSCVAEGTKKPKKVKKGSFTGTIAIS